MAVISGALRAWKAVVLDFESAPVLSEAPSTFLDYRLDLRFEHDGPGGAFVVPGFFAADGAADQTCASAGGVWRVLFRPPAEGVWRWRARFRVGPGVAVEDPAAVDFVGGGAGAFDGESGALRIGRADGAAPDLAAWGPVRLEDDILRFPASGHSQPVQPLPAFGLLHGAEFDGAVPGAPELAAAAPQSWRQGDPIWGGGSLRGKGIIGALRLAQSEGANLLRAAPLIRRSDQSLSGPWRLETPSDERSVFDVSRLEQWRLALETAERFGICIAMLVGARDSQGADFSLAALGLDRVERRLLIRELAARFGHLNGLIWDATPDFLGEEERFLAELDEPRSAVGAAVDAATSADAPLEPVVSEATMRAGSPFPAELPTTSSYGASEVDEVFSADVQVADYDGQLYEWQFVSVDDVDQFLDGPDAIRLNMLTSRALEAALNILDFDPLIAEDAADEPDDPVEEETPTASEPSAALGPVPEPPTQEADSAEPGSKQAQISIERSEEAEEAPAEQPEAAVESADVASGDARDYVGETGPMDEIDEALAQLRKSQKASKVPPQPTPARPGGVRAARRNLSAPVTPGDGGRSRAEPRSKTAEARAQRLDVERSEQASAKRQPAAAVEEKEIKRKRFVAGIGDADGAASGEGLGLFAEPEATTEPPAPEPNPLTVQAPAPRVPAPKPVESPLIAPRRRARPRPSLPAQQGAAVISLSMYLMRGGSEDAVAVSLTEPFDPAALTSEGASLILRFAGADAPKATYARLSITAAEAETTRIEPVERFALFEGLAHYASKVASAGAALGPASAAPMLEVAVFSNPSGQGEPLKLWRLPFSPPEEEAVQAAPEGPSRDQLAAQAQETAPRLVRIELIDPEFDQVVASFGPSGSDAPVEAAGRALSVKAVIGGGAIAAQRARLFVPSSARCARPEDRPTPLGAQAVCHFYGCVFAPGRQEVELVAFETAEALERFIDRPAREAPGLLLRARVRITLS